MQKFTNINKNLFADIIVKKILLLKKEVLILFL